MSAATLPAAAPVGDALALAGRNLRIFLRTPELVVFATLQPALVVLMFRYVFAGAVTVPGGSYADFLLPAIFAQTVVFAAVGTGVGLAEDVRAGMVDRFRALPTARSAVLAGRALADVVRALLVITLMAAVVLAVGFRARTGPLSWLAAGGVLLAYAFALSWLFALIALYSSGPEGAEAVGFPLLVPLVFASSAFVPVETMPGWLQAFAAHQPVTATVDAVRVLLLGGPAEAVLTSLLWSAGLVAVLAPLAVARFRRLS